MARIDIDIFCVFPEAVEATLKVGVVGRALERGLARVRSHDLREFTENGRIDDMPYGGGAGMVFRVDVVARALEAVYGVAAREVREERPVLLTDPGGRSFDQAYARELAVGGGLAIICGRYEGVDERVRSELCSGSVSLGGFVLSGGEVVAAAVADAVLRLGEGVLGNSESLVGESFESEGVMGPPQYTRPAEWDGVRVPNVLLSGNHAEIQAWRTRRAAERAK